MLNNMIGVEAEFFLLNKKGEVIVPPASWDRDGFPLLGEIRGEPGKNTAEVYANFIKRELEINLKCADDNIIIMDNFRQIKLAVYRKAMAEMRRGETEKWAVTENIRNIHGTDINDFSDQIIGKNHKIQGINASCGLHIHFSSEMIVEKEVREEQYEYFPVPISLGSKDGLTTQLELYKYKGYDKKETLTARASQLNQPTIEWIVKQMDTKFFGMFAPPEAERTKYRKHGFYETKPYGFEYRSLPANMESIAALPVIIEFAFSLLDELRIK